MSATGNKLRVLVVGGGDSPEREISRAGADAVVKALRSQGHLATHADPRRKNFDLERMRFRPDVLFPVLHGPGGEDGTIQGYAEQLGLPYVGSDGVGSALSFDKPTTKILARHAGIPTAQDVVTAHPAQQPPFLPCVVKPTRLGSSIGVSIVERILQWQPAVSKAQRYGPAVLIERYLEGQEVSVGVVALPKPRILPIARLLPKGRFFDYRAKYDGSTVEEIPAEIPRPSARLLARYTLTLFDALGLRDFARLDYILTPDLDPYLLDVNTIPGLTKESILPKMLRSAGISFETFTSQLVTAAFERKRR